MLGFLRSIGLTPNMFYAAERLAVFVGLWPPTLFLMGHALREDDKAV
jgi:hypothetical protein